MTLRQAVPLLGGLVIAAWAIHALGTGPGSVLQAALVLAVALLPWGWLVTRRMAAGVLLRGERVALAALAGYPVSATAYYLLSLAGLHAAFLPASLLLGVGLAFSAKRSGAWTAPESLEERARPHWSLPLLAPLALLVTTRGNGAFEAVAEGLAYNHSVDHSLHLAFYWEMLRGFPPLQVPAAAGLPFPAYHVLAFMPGLLLVRATDLPLTTVYHALLPLMKVSLLMAGAYLAVRVRTGDGKAATAAIPAFFVAVYAFETAFDGRFIVGPPPHFDLLRNEAEAGGLLVWTAVACLLALHDRVKAQPETARGAAAPFWLACALAGLSYGFKAQLFLLLGGAFGLALLLWLLRERSRVPLCGLLVMGAGFALLFWLSRGSGRMAEIEWRPGLFAELYVYPNLRRDPWPLVSGTLRDALVSFPAGLGYLFAIPLAVWRVVAFSPLVVVYLLDSARQARRLGLADAVASLAFLLALPMGYGLSVVSVYRETSPFEFRQAVHGLALLGCLIDVVALHALLRRYGSRAAERVLAAVAVATLLCVPVLLEPPYLPPRTAIVLTPDEQCTLLFLRERTSPDAVVVSARPGGARLNHHAVIAGFAGRRSVLEFYWDNARQHDAERLFATRKPAIARQILDRYGVDYVVETRGTALRSVPEGLQLVYERGVERIYRVPREGTPPESRTVPELFRRPDPLRCGSGPPRPNLSAEPLP